jgi:hypothetical protein
MSSAGDSARATNDNVVSVDASRYFAGLICGSVRAVDAEGRPQTPAEIKKVILTERCVVCMYVRECSGVMRVCVFMRERKMEGVR